MTEPPSYYWLFKTSWLQHNVSRAEVRKLRIGRATQNLGGTTSHNPMSSLVHHGLSLVMVTVFHMLEAIALAIALANAL